MELMAKSYRGDVLDLVAYGSYCIVDSKGNILDRRGDIGEYAYGRSSMKLIQALVPLMLGAKERFDMSFSEIAQICASHSGEKIHIDTVTNLLHKIGLDESYLKCGAHYPYKESVRDEMKKNGEPARDIHNNCSGKHTGMLSSCVIEGYSLSDYYKITHPIQKRIKEVVAILCDIDEDEIHMGIDGCGVPVHAVPIYNFAYAMARMSDPECLDEYLRKPVKDVTEALLNAPVYASGTDRIDYHIISKNPGNIVVKAGANGYFAGYLIKEKIGFALKMYDATPDIKNVVIIDLMRKLNAIRNDDEEFFEQTYPHDVFNHRKEVVGYIETIL